METTTQPAPQGEHTPTPEPFWIPLRMDDCAGYNDTRKEHVSEGYHYIDGGVGYIDDRRPNAGIGLAGCMSTEQAKYIIEAVNSHARLLEQNRAMREALEAIAKGEGRFSRDPLTHASNTIEDMKAIALSTLNPTEGV